MDKTGGEIPPWLCLCLQYDLVSFYELQSIIFQAHGTYNII